MLPHARRALLALPAVLALACGSSSEPGTSTPDAQQAADAAADAPGAARADAAADFGIIVPRNDGGAEGGATQTCGRAAGACVNATDCQKSRTDVNAKVAECGQRCFGAGPCTAMCLKDGLGITQGCADCWGAVVQCGRDKCLTQCINGTDTPACRDCTASAGCDSAFATCSGL
jgi:hypothetical protein